jgi:uncharacterized protein
MSLNKRTIEKYLEGFRQGDHGSILDCLAEDVIWEMPGVYLREGRAAFDTEIENEGFIGRPEISVARMLEDDDVVVVEATVRHERSEGDSLHARFCDVFDMDAGKIKRLTSYLMMVPTVTSAVD